MLSKWFRTSQSIETMSRVRRLQGHATIIYEHIKIISKIERTRRCRTAFRRREIIIFKRNCVRFSCSSDGERSDCIHCCASTATTQFLYYYYSMSPTIGIDFNVFIKFGLFAILFLIFIGIKLMTNAGEDCVRTDAVVSSMDAVGSGPEQPHGIMSFVFIFFYNLNIVRGVICAHSEFDWTSQEVEILHFAKRIRSFLAYIIDFAYVYEFDQFFFY